MVSHSGPSTLQAILNEGEEDVQMLHLLHYIPEKRAEDIYTIEDVIPLFNTEVEMNVGDKAIKRVLLVPEQQEIAYCQDRDILSFQIPEIKGHQIIKVEMNS